MIRRVKVFAVLRAFAVASTILLAVIFFPFVWPDASGERPSTISSVSSAARLSPGAITLAVDADSSQVHWTLGATAHTVHGTFKVSKGSFELDPDSGKAWGEIVVAATSGESGNDGRDKKMHNEVLESSRYSDIVFRPDHVDGKVATNGASTVQVHGTFSLHGASHETTVRIDANVSAGHWTATSKFKIPYVQWGLKNPSTFILRVKQEVEVQLNLQGQVLPSGR